MCVQLYQQAAQQRWSSALREVLTAAERRDSAGAAAKIFGNTVVSKMQSAHSVRGQASTRSAPATKIATVALGVAKRRGFRNTSPDFLPGGRVAKLAGFRNTKPAPAN